MKKSDFMFPFISVASVHGAEVFRTHMLASLLVRPKIRNLRLKCCFYLIRTAAPTLWICSLVACFGTVFSIYSAYTLKLPFRTACLNMKSCVERVVSGFSETLMGIFVKLFLFWFFLPSSKCFAVDKMSEEDKGRVDGSAADGCVVIKDTKLRQWTAS